MRADQDVVHHAEIAEDATKLERTRDTIARQSLGRKAGDDLPIETDLSAIGPVEPGNEIEQGCLAGTVRAYDADQIAFGKVEIDAVDSSKSPEAPHQSAQGKQGCRAGDWRVRASSDLLGHQMVPNRPCGLNRTSSKRTMPQIRMRYSAAIRKTSGRPTNATEPTIAPAALPNPPRITMVNARMDCCVLKVS